MAAFSGPNIAQTGLVMNLDAGDLLSYPGTGTTVTDLTRNNNNGTLTGSPGYTASVGGYFSFTGSNNITYTNSSLIPSADFTIDTWVYYTTTAQSNFANIGNESSNRIVFFAFNNSIQYNIYGAGSVTMSTGFVNNVWNHVVITRTGSTIISYTNGVPGTSLTLSGGLGNANGTTIMSNSGNVAIYRYYQGVGLTQSQVLQNFNAIRSRYGL